MTQSVVIEQLSSSFKDPSGFMFQHNGEIYRQINDSYQNEYAFMVSTGFMKQAVSENLLVNYEEIVDSAIQSPTYKIIKPNKIPFISYPYEWSFTQLKDAALHTLKVQGLAFKYGLWLKDASAYNVQFYNGQPIFIDSLSFERYPEGSPWVAYKQFCQHFLAPLALMAYTHIDLSKLLRLYIDGIPLDLASQILPRRTKLRPSLLMHLHLHSRMQQKHANIASASNKPKTNKISKIGFEGIIDSLTSSIQKIRWKPGGTEWADYYKATNYSESATDNKSLLIKNMLHVLKPASLWDIGANNGAYSRIASNMGIQTVSFDIDPSAVEMNYQKAQGNNDTNLLPLVMDLTNPSPAIGWSSQERSSLIQRGPVDTVMALALIHHLAISNNLPFENIARFFQCICHHLIIEFVPKSDSQVKRLLTTRKDIFPNYTQSHFEKVFSSLFEIVRSDPMEGTVRTLYLMKTKSIPSPTP